MTHVAASGEDMQKSTYVVGRNHVLWNADSTVGELNDTSCKVQFKYRCFDDRLPPHMASLEPAVFHIQPPALPEFKMELKNVRVVEHKGRNDDPVKVCFRDHGREACYEEQKECIKNCQTNVRFGANAEAQQSDLLARTLAAAPVRR